MTAVSTTVTDKFGRRSLMVYSLTTMGVCLLALSYYFFAKTYKARVVDSLGWLPLVAVAVYVSVYAVGCGPVPYVIVGEIFSSEVSNGRNGARTTENRIRGGRKVTRRLRGSIFFRLGLGGGVGNFRHFRISQSERNGFAISAE